MAETILNLEQAPSGVDIEPDSLLWRIAGDYRVNLCVASTALIQAMVPAIGAGVNDHSNIFVNPWDRIQRSAGPIAQAIYGPNAEKVAEDIKKRHKNIRGTDEQGRAYHALNPETYGRAHISFLHMYEDTYDRFTPYTLNMNAREQLHDDMSVVFMRYGYKRPFTPNYYAYKHLWHHLEQELEMTPAAEWGFDQVLGGKLDRPPFFPECAWRGEGKKAGRELVRLTAIGGLSEDVRRRFGLPWSIADRLKLAAIEFAAQTVGQAMPAEKRYMPVAYAALKQAGVTLR